MKLIASSAGSMESEAVMGRRSMAGSSSAQA
jgi:hypothetical protein